MWRIYILALWSHPLTAQYGERIESRGGGRQADYNSSLQMFAVNSSSVNLTQLPSAYNKNSRDSFGYKYNVRESQLFLSGEERQTKNRHYIDIDNTKNSLLSTPAILKVDSETTQSPTTWKLPTNSYFDAKLFDIMSTKAQHQNLVYSPISLQILLEFIFTISDGKLYEELAQLLAISNNRTNISKVFEKVLQKSSIDTQHTTLIIANKLYYDHRFGPINQTVRNIVKQSFDIELEQLNFFESKKAVNSINSWVRNKTHNLIKEIVTSISAETNALLLSSIYFKSEWLTKFAPDDTETQDFFLSRQIKIPVNMMYNEDIFRYGDFPDDLQASAVELPFKTSNLSMLLILPLEMEGLSNLERKLKSYDFTSISQNLKREIVTVKLPKFKIECEINIIEAFQEMGLHGLFNNDGDINLFKDFQNPLKVDHLKHKSFVNVNEDGIEAAATTVAKYVPLSIPTDMKYFVADHPFVFVIRNTYTIFFIGRVVRF